MSALPKKIHPEKQKKYLDWQLYVVDEAPLLIQCCLILHDFLVQADDEDGADADCQIDYLECLRRNEKVLVVQEVFVIFAHN